MQLSSELGQRLHDLRLSLGLKQNEMALAAGLNPGYLSEIISGKKSNPGIDLVIKIAKRFNVSLDYLLLGEGEMFLPDKEEELRKEKELNLVIDTIDDLFRVMKRSNYVKNSVLGYGIKVCIDDEVTIRKEVEKLMEKEKTKDIDDELEETLTAGDENKVPVKKKLPLKKWPGSNRR